MEYSSPRDWGMVPQEFLAQGEWGEHDQAACHVLLTTLQLHMGLSSLKLSIKHWGNLLRGGGGWGGPAMGGLGVGGTCRSRMQSHRMQSNAFYHHLEMQCFPQKGNHGADPATQV